MFGQRYTNENIAFIRITNLDALNEKQREAVVSTDKRLLVLAGAGSGKTKTLLQKIIYLIKEKGVSPHDILAITFTKNAANEMLDRLILTADTQGKYADILHDKKKSQSQKEDARRTFTRQFKWIEGLTVRTFHSFGYSILRNLGVNEFDNKFRIITNEPVREQDEFARYLAPETAFDMVSKLIIQRCEEAAHLLDLNYRSTQNIVGASNEVIKNNKFKIEKDIRSSKVSEHKIVVYAGNNDKDNKQY